MVPASVTVDVKAALPHRQWMAWLICLSAGLFFSYEFFQLNLFDVINTSLRKEFLINASQISWMSSSYLWADILFLLPAGIILDRFSTRLVILIAMLICVVSTIGFAFAQSFFMASFCHFLAGIGNAFCFLACVVLVARWFPPRRQGLVVGCVVTMAFIGGLMAHTPLAYLNAHYGWRIALLIDGGVGILIFLWILLIVKDYPRHYVAVRVEKELQPSFFKPLLNRQNWLAGFYIGCLNLPIMVLCALWGASYLQTVHHLSNIVASNVVSLIFVGSILGCPLLGWLSDALGRRKPLMIGGAVASLLTILPLFMGIPLSETVLSSLFFILGLVTSAQVIGYPFIAESNQINNTGTATGIASVIIMGGAGVGQVLFGVLMHYHATLARYTTVDFQFAMWIFPVTILMALLAITFARETYCKRY